MPITLTRRGWGLLLAAALTGASWTVVGLRDLWYLAALLAALPLLALLAAAAAPLARFEVRVSASDPAPQVGDPVALTARIRHRLPFALAVGVVWFAGAGTGPGAGGAPEPAPPAPLRVPPRGAAERLSWVPGRRGPARAGVAALLLSDPLGLAVRRVAVDRAVEVLVLPRPLGGVPPMGDGGAAGVERCTARGAAGGSGAPGGSVREYRSGDALRQVHWKQSARQGQLLVNVPEDSAGDERVLLLDTAPAAYRSARAFESAVSAAAAVALDWIRAGHPVLLHASAGDGPGAAPAEGAGGARRLETADDALRALARVAVAPPDEAGELPPRCDVAVTGAPTARLAAGLAASPRPGTVLAVERGAEAGVPSGWRLLVPAAAGATPDEPGAADGPDRTGGRRERHGAGRA